MAREDLATDGAIIGGQVEIPALVQNFRRKPRPAAVNFSAAYAPAEHEHDVGVPMIGAAIAVFPCGAAEFRHRDEHHIFHPIAEILIESREALAQLF